MIKFLMVVLATTLISSVQSAVTADQFTQLPDCPTPMASNSYSGMLNITDSKSLHYTFLESTNDPSTDPVLLWSNGGPGCSSLLGLFAENGPYILDNNN